MTRRTDPKPKTAWDLCERVAKHIEDEPLRYTQSTWWIRGKQLAFHISECGMTPPPCGTAACRGGWIVGLHDGVRGARKIFGRGFAERAREILDVSERSVLKLFNAYSVSGVQGTPEYAAEGAAGLRRWMKRRAAHLKARLLKDVPPLRSEGQ